MLPAPAPAPLRASARPSIVLAVTFRLRLPLASTVRSVPAIAVLASDPSTCTLPSARALPPVLVAAIVAVSPAMARVVASAPLRLVVFVSDTTVLTSWVLRSSRPPRRFSPAVASPATLLAVARTTSLAVAARFRPAPA